MHNFLPQCHQVRFCYILLFLYLLRLIFLHQTKAWRASQGALGYNCILFSPPNSQQLPWWWRISTEGKGKKDRNSIYCIQSLLLCIKKNKFCLESNTNFMQFLHLWVGNVAGCRVHYEWFCTGRWVWNVPFHCTTV